MIFKVFTLSVFFTAIPLFSQSNETIDAFLNREKADLATTAMLIYQASGAISLDATPDDAMRYLLASEIGGRYEGRRGDLPVQYRQYAHIVMDELELPGGLLYRIFRSPRYAARGMTYRRWMPGDPSPRAELTPWEVMTSLSRILTWKEEN